ncbi:MAG: 3'-5' exonuclease [Trueperaceae bacterium]
MVPHDDAPPMDGNDTLDTRETVDTNVDAGPPRDPELERAADLLESSGEYRVLRRLRPPKEYALPSEDTEVLLGIYIDVETTGLDAGTEAIIELGLVAFEFDRQGNVYRIVRELSAFEDPGKPIPPHITALTGIRDEDVRGARLPEGDVTALAERAQLVVAHNAAFDRPFLERRLPVFEGRPWACSMADVDWSDAGFGSQKLEYLAYRRGFFFDGHRASNDCLAGVHLLAVPLPGETVPPLANLLQNARRSSVRLWAENSPFESKDLLKERSYRWSAAARMWWRELPKAEHDAELDWLAANVYGGHVPLPYLEVSAFLRYSARVPDIPPKGATRK